MSLMASIDGHYRVELRRSVPCYLRFGKFQVPFYHDGQTKTCRKCGDSDQIAKDAKILFASIVTKPDMWQRTATIIRKVASANPTNTKQWTARFCGTVDQPHIARMNLHLINRKLTFQNLMVLSKIKINPKKTLLKAQKI